MGTKTSHSQTAPETPQADLPVVLVVDDDREMRGYLRRCLEPLSARIGTIHESAAGPEAIDRARQLGVDLMITRDEIEVPAAEVGRLTPPCRVLRLGVAGLADAGAGRNGLFTLDRQMVCRRVERHLAHQGSTI